MDVLDEEVDIILYYADGQEAATTSVEVSENGTIHIDLEAFNLGAGVYFITVSMSDAQYFGKLVLIE